MVVGMKKIVKLTFVGEKDMSKTEELLFQVALHELKEGSLSDFGVVFNQPIITPGEAGSFIEIEYPSDIKERIEKPVKKEEEGLSDQAYIHLLEKLVKKYSGKSVSQCIYECI